MRVILRRHFDAAHQLPYHGGKCRQLHGHRWTVELVVGGEIRADDATDPQSGMVCDFAVLKALLDAYLPDHRSLNSAQPVRPHVAPVPPGSLWTHGAGTGLPNPTAERLAERMALDLAPELEKLGVELITLAVWENPESAAVVDL